MDDPIAALSTLDASLDGLEAALAPLLETTRAAALAPLSSVDKAKLDVLLAFAANNLVWIYLRTRGIDPETHDVARELERIQTYYGKVRAAEAGPSTRSRIDVPAAGRLIANSIPKRQHLPSVAADTPATSAAALAAEQAYDATRANRFRFVAKEGEKLIPGEDDDEDDAEAAANSLLDSVEADIVASEVAPKKKSSKSKATKAKPAKKRKRAE